MAHTASARGAGRDSTRERDHPGTAGDGGADWALKDEIIWGLGWKAELLKNQLSREKGSSAPRNQNQNQETKDGRALRALLSNGTLGCELGAGPLLHKA